MNVDIFLPETSIAVNMCPMRVLQIAPECCPPVLEDPLDQSEADRLARAFRVIADPARLRLLGLIAGYPDHEACVCHLTEPLGLSQPTVSHHLKVLHEAGILDRERRGKWVYYRLVPGTLRLLRDALDV
jgi:ArsR family transcriptional regulator, arsenate/arsenite/antimonite-responsive transcriptional repressor